nr:DUF4124 domain-containing protein [Shewanella jiangmenensis]
MLPPKVAAEEIYKWVDKDGKVHFGDRPGDNAEAVKPKNSIKADADADEPSFSRKFTPEKSQILGRWTDSSDIDVDEYFGGDGSYMGTTSIIGVKVEMHGRWTLNGNRLVITLHRTVSSGYGKSKTSTESKVDDRKIIYISSSKINYISAGKDGQEATMTRTGS